MSLKRVQKELTDVTSKGFAVDIKDDVTVWKLSFTGPEGTMYETQVFVLKIQFSTDYPFKPPTVVFETQMYHPNINSKGDICLDILKDKWNPSITTMHVISGIKELIKTPNVDDPLVPEIADVYTSNKALYELKVREVLKM